jgi:hypothetical protein
MTDFEYARQLENLWLEMIEEYGERGGDDDGLIKASEQKNPIIKKAMLLIGNQFESKRGKK